MLSVLVLKKSKDPMVRYSKSSQKLNHLRQNNKYLPISFLPAIFEKKHTPLNTKVGLCFPEIRHHICQENYTFAAHNNPHLIFTQVLHATNWVKNAT